MKTPRIRHIKCDETYPVCKKCLSHGVSCHYALRWRAPPTDGDVDGTAAPIPIQVKPRDWDLMQGIHFCTFDLSCFSLCLHLCFAAFVPLSLFFRLFFAFSLFLFHFAVSLLCLSRYLPRMRFTKHTHTVATARPIIYTVPPDTSHKAMHVMMQRLLSNGAAPRFLGVMMRHQICTLYAA